MAKKEQLEKLNTLTVIMVVILIIVIVIIVLLFEISDCKYENNQLRENRIEQVLEREPNPAEVIGVIEPLSSAPKEIILMPVNFSYKITSFKAECHYDSYAYHRLNKEFEPLYLENITLLSIYDDLNIRNTFSTKMQRFKVNLAGNISWNDFDDCRWNAVIDYIMYDVNGTIYAERCFIGEGSFPPDPRNFYVGNKFLECLRSQIRI